MPNWIRIERPFLSATSQNPVHMATHKFESQRIAYELKQQMEQSFCIDCIHTPTVRRALPTDFDADNLIHARPCKGLSVTEHQDPSRYERRYTCYCSEAFEQHKAALSPARKIQLARLMIKAQGKTDDGD